MINLNVITYNCRGLNNHSKRRNLFFWLKKQKFDIILLQETYCTAKLEPFFKSDWSGIAVNAISNSSHSRGVSVLLGQGFQGKVLESFSDNEGRTLVVNIQLCDEVLHVVSVYAPNAEKERITFFETLHTTIIKHCNNLNNVFIER